MRHSLSMLCAAALVVTAPMRAPPLTAAPRKTVAVLYFDNFTGRADFDPLGKGIASMMISDLSAVPEIQLLERDRIQDLVKEMELQHTKFFDSTTAVKVGRMSGAEYIVVGSFAALQPRMKIDTRVVRVETGEIVKTAQVTGDDDKFFELQQRLASDLVNGLGLALSPEGQQRLAAKQEQNRVDALSTMVTFSRALAQYDKADFSGAVETMAPALQASPRSMFIRSAFDEMKSRATASATQKAKDKIKSGLGGLLRRP